MRDKWDEVHRPADGATYGQMTIETAIEGTTNRYQTRAERIMSDNADVTAILDRIDKTIDDVINLAYDGQAGSRELFIDVYRGRLCFDHAAGTWYEFQGMLGEGSGGMGLMNVAPSRGYLNGQTRS